MPGETGSAAEAAMPETLSEARAVIAQMTAECAELTESLHRVREALRESAAKLSTMSLTMQALLDHDARAVAALGDVLATFLLGRDGWARSVSVPAADIDGWSSAAWSWEDMQSDT